jgi:hypothetical protein
MAEKLKFFEKFERKTNLSCSQPRHLLMTALDHLTICLVANKYTKQVKICYLVPMLHLDALFLAFLNGAAFFAEKNTF